MNFFRKSLILTLLLSGLFASGSLHAQVSRVAFVTGDHAKIYFTDGTKLDSTTIIDTATVNAGLRAAGVSGMTGVSKLSVLASTSDGKHLMIAGHFLYPNQVTTLQDSSDAIILLDAPFLLTSQIDLLTKFKILKHINPPVNIVNLSIPVGMIAANDLDWYATWTGSQVGSPQLWFYHGHLNEVDGPTATHLDSIEYPTDQSHQIQGDFHMSNLAANPGGNVMIAVIVDQLSNQVNGPDFHAIRWEPHPPGPTQVFRTTLFTNSVSSKFGLPVVSRDFNFGLGIRTKDNDVAEMILAKDSGADLITETYNYNGNSIVLATGTTIPRTMIPSSEYFFDGYQAEVDPNAKQRGNGGDIVFIGNSDSILFLTHSALEDLDYTKSKLRIGSISSGTSKILYDNGKRHPLHPVWMQGVPAAPPKHKYIALSTATIDFGTVEFAKTGTNTVTISNPSDSDVTVDSIKLTGPNASSFSVTPASALPFNLPKGSTSIAAVKFHSSDPVGVRNAMLTVFFGGHSDSIRQVTITGTTKDTAHVGVALEPSAITSLSITPNPTHNAATITFEAAKSGLMHVELRDLLGHEVYSAEAVQMSAGSKHTLQFDAATLNLPNGVYYLTANIAGDKLTRQLVIVK